MRGDGDLFGPFLSRTIWVLSDKILGFWSVHFIFLPILKDFRTLQIRLDQFCANPERERFYLFFFFYAYFGGHIHYCLNKCFFAYFEGFISDR